jgi:hypothetical protein
LGIPSSAAISRRLTNIHLSALFARHTPYSVFGYASYNSDPAGAGTTVITRDLTDSTIVGAAVNGDYDQHGL